MGEVENKREHIDYAKLAGMLARIKTKQPITSVMCFGGEPLLHPDDVCAIFTEAKRVGIHKRQLITNGFFSRASVSSSREKITAATDKLNQCATEILLSVDAFHQDSIPLEPVQAFANSAKHVRLHPAWLVSPADDNPWNRRTREILTRFPGVPVSDGNVVFPRGNALKYLREYFPGDLPRRSPYEEEPGHVTSLFVCPNGDVHAAGITIGNAYRDDILEMLR